MIFNVLLFCLLSTTTSYLKKLGTLYCIVLKKFPSLCCQDEARDNRKGKERFEIGALGKGHRC